MDGAEKGLRTEDTTQKGLASRFQVPTSINFSYIMSSPGMMTMGQMYTFRVNSVPRAVGGLEYGLPSPGCPCLLGSHHAEACKLGSRCGAITARSLSSHSQRPMSCSLRVAFSLLRRQEAHLGHPPLLMWTPRSLRPALGQVRPGAPSRLASGT